MGKSKWHRMAKVTKVNVLLCIRSKNEETGGQSKPHGTK